MVVLSVELIDSEKSSIGMVVDDGEGEVVVTHADDAIDVGGDWLWGGELADGVAASVVADEGFDRRAPVVFRMVDSHKSAFGNCLLPIGIR